MVPGAVGYGWFMTWVLGGWYMEYMPGWCIQIGP